MQFYIETERLILRDLQPADDAGMFELDSDADVHKYVGKNPIQTIEQARDVVEMVRAQYEANGIGRWAVIEKSTGDFVGWSGLKLMKGIVTNGHTGYYDLGYRFIKRAWGKGYATEAALAAVRYAWNTLHLSELYAEADINNIASQKVLEKAGMQFVETFDREDKQLKWYKQVKENIPIPGK